MKNKSQINNIKKKILPILKKNHIIKAGIFGSYARGDNKKNSDVDILIQIKNGKKFSLFDMIGLQIEIEKRLKRKVDLITYESISPYLKRYILEDEIKII